MALVYTLRASVSGTGGVADTLTTASFTPGSSSLLVAIASGLLTAPRSAPPTISNTGTALTWTLRLDTVQSNGNAALVAIWTAPVVTGAAMTVTVDYNAASLDSSVGHSLVVVQFTGHNTTTPVAQTFEDGGTTGHSGAYSGTLGAAPAGVNYLLTAAVAEAATAANVAAGSGWTSILDTAMGDGATLFQYRTGTVSTNVALADLTTGSSSATAALDFDDAQANDDQIQVHTFPMTVAEAAGQERLVFLGGITNGATADFEVCTVDGVSATRVGTLVQGSTDIGGNHAFITAYRATGTANTSIDIVGTLGGGGFSQHVYGACCACYKLSNADSVLATATSSSNDPTLSLNTVTNGAVAAGVFGYPESGGNMLAAWTGLTEDFDDVSSYTDDDFTGASATVTSGETPRAISADMTPDADDPNASIASIALSFNPVAGASAWAVGGIEIKAATATSASIEFNATDTDAADVTNGNTYTFVFPSVVGAGGQERLVALGGIGGNDATFSACTIDGVTATQVGSVVRGATVAATGLNSFLALYRAAGTVNTTMNVVATYSGTSRTCTAGYCACFKLSDAGIHFASGSSSVDPATVSCNTSANGAAVGATLAFTGAGLTTTWTGLSETFDSIRVGGDDVFSGGVASATTAATPRTISANISGSQSAASDSVAGIAASFALTSAATAYSILALPGAYTISGTAATTAKGQFFTVPIDGSYALSGVDASMAFGRGMTAEPSNYDLTGSSATLTGSVASLGAIVVTFEDSHAHAEFVDSGLAYTISLTVSDATDAERIIVVGGVTNSGNVDGDFSTVTVDGETAVRLGTVQQGQVDITGYYPFLTAYRAPGTANTEIDVVATFSATGFEPESYGVYCLAYKLEGAGDLIDFNSSNAVDPALNVNAVEDGAVIASVVAYNYPDEGSDPIITWTGVTQDHRLTLGYSYIWGASAETTTDETPRTVSGNSTITTDTRNASAALAMSFASLFGGGASGSGMLVADAGSYELTGAEAALTASGQLLLLPGSYTLTGFDVGMSKTGANAVLSIAAGSYALSGSTVSLSYGLRVQALTAGSYVITSDSVVSGDGLIADPGSYAMTGAAAGLVLVQGSGGGVAVFVDAIGNQVSASTADASVTISGGIAVLVEGNAVGALSGATGSTSTTVLTTGGINVDATGTDLAATASVGDATVSISAAIDATMTGMTASVGDETVSAFASVSVELTGNGMRAYVEPLDHAGSGWVPGTVKRKQVQGEMLELGRMMGH